MKIEWNGLVANVWYDDYPGNPGWFAEYSDDRGVFSDSMKVWEEEMPRRIDAQKKALRVALRTLKAEARRRMEYG